MKTRLLLPILVIALMGKLTAQTEPDPLTSRGYTPAEQNIIRGLVQSPGEAREFDAVAAIIQTAPEELRQHLKLDLPGPRETYSFPQKLVYLDEFEMRGKKYRVCVFQPSHWTTHHDNFHQVVLLDQENKACSWLRTGGENKFQMATLYLPESRGMWRDSNLTRVFLTVVSTKLRGKYGTGGLYFQMFRLEPDRITLVGEGYNSEELQKMANAQAN